MASAPDRQPALIGAAPPDAVAPGPADTAASVAAPAPVTMLRRLGTGPRVAGAAAIAVLAAAS